ncbi:MAG TPA: hypothetical protein VIH18_32570 [Candidatus Binatia bacterium]|jgi:hypothetical protein
MRQRAWGVILATLIVSPGRVSVQRVFFGVQPGGSVRHIMFKGDLACVEKISVTP